MKKPIVNERNQLAILLVLCIAMWLPFVNKPFHIDSPVTLYIAKQMSINLLNPPIDNYGKLLSLWNRTELPEESAFSSTPHPPLIPLYLTAFVSIFGEKEFFLNFAMFPFYVGSVLFFWLIAKKFVKRWAFESAVLFLMCPAVLVNSHNVMLDIPLAMFVNAAFFFMFGSNWKYSAAFSGACAALATLTKYTAATVFVAAVVFYLSSKRWKDLILFLIPFLTITGLWTLHNLIFWGKLQLLANGHMRYLLGDIRYRLERLVSFAGSTIVLPIVPVLLSVKVKKYRIILLCATSGSAIWALLMYKILHYTIAESFFYALSATSGILLIYFVLFVFSGQYSKSEYIAIVVHFLLQIVGGLFLTLYATRYLLPALFSPILSLTMLIDVAVSAKWKRTVWYSIIFSSCALALGLSISDFQTAFINKKIASDLKSFYPGNNIYYMGRLGYLYYMNRAGFHNYCLGNKTINRGDIIVQNTANGDDWQMISNHQKNLTELMQISYKVFPLRTIGGRAGFYGNDRLAYWLSTTPIVFKVYQAQ